MTQVGAIKADALCALGADETISRDDTPKADSVDAVFDLVAGPSWPTLIDA
ncbi:MAG: hypothetical protein AAFO70_09235 [Pseudomonadota bacterium]